MQNVKKNTCRLAMIAILSMSVSNIAFAATDASTDNIKKLEDKVKEYELRLEALEAELAEQKKQKTQNQGTRSPNAKLRITDENKLKDHENRLDALENQNKLAPGPFADVPLNHWAYSAANQLANDGLIEGYADGTFRGDKALTRYEMAIVVGKALEHMDKASAEDKALLDKLSTEFAKELQSLGVRVTKLEQKVDDIGKVKISGVNQALFRIIHDKPNIGRYGQNTSYGDNLIMINMNVKVSDNVNVFARLAERNFFGGTYHSTIASKFFETPTLDHFGTSVKTGLWDISFGRQAVLLGQGSLLSTGVWPGIAPQFEGLIASGRLDNNTTVFHLIGGRTSTNDFIQNYLNPDYQGGTWWGGDVSFKMSKQITLGALYAAERRDETPKKNFKYKGMNVAINLNGPFTLSGEYIKSDADTDNRAYQVALTYAQGKDVITAWHLDTQKNSIDQYTSSIGGYQLPLGASLDAVNFSGNALLWNHNLTKNIQSNIYMCSLSENGKPGRNQEYIGGFTFTF